MRTFIFLIIGIMSMGPLISWGSEDGQRPPLRCEGKVLGSWEKIVIHFDGYSWPYFSFINYSTYDLKVSEVDGQLPPEMGSKPYKIFTITDEVELYVIRFLTGGDFISPGVNATMDFYVGDGSSIEKNPMFCQWDAQATETGR